MDSIDQYIEKPEGESDLGPNAGSEWFSGHALADQLALLARLGVQGAGLYRYGSLFANSDAPALAESEAEAIKGVWQG